MAADEGDPRFASPIWEGRYEIVTNDATNAIATWTNPTVMLGKDNSVQFCGDADVTDEWKTIGILPSGLRPSKTSIKIPVIMQVDKSTDTGWQVSFLHINISGTMYVPVIGYYRLNGLSFHLSGNYY